MAGTATSPCRAARIARRFRRIIPCTVCCVRLTTMLRLGSRRQTVLSEAFRELANLSMAALVLAQFAGGGRWSFAVFSAGIAMWFMLVGLALFLAGGE